MTYFVKGEHVSHVLLLHFSNLFLLCFVCECLSDWIVKHFLTLDKLVGYFLVGFCDALEVCLLRYIVIHVLLPGAVPINQAMLLCSFSSCVHFR